MRVHWLAGPALFLAVAATATPLPPALVGGEPVQVSEVLDGETLRLAGGGEVRLAGILAPGPGLPRAGQAARPEPELERLGAAARGALAALIDGQRITLHVAGPPRDRHGRQVAHVTGPTNEWVQAALVSQGLARVQTTADSHAGAEALLRLEAAARDARLGLWRHETFRVRAPGELGRWIDTFQIVEGVAAGASGQRAGGRLAIEGDGARLLLNLSSRTRTELRAAGRAGETLAGQAVRVRGWVRWQNGPVIDVTHAAQIEPLAAP